MCHVKSAALQALIQMQDTPAAVSALQFYANVQPAVRYKDFACILFWSTLVYTLCKSHVPNL